MTEKELLFSRALDKKNESEKNLMITNTSFLSIDERGELISLRKKLTDTVRMFFYGGYPEAERTVAMFIPPYYELEGDLFGHFVKYSDDNPIVAVRMNKDKFSALSHKDYLGALMGLGIKREMLGDIITDSDGAYVFCLNSVAGYICENLNKSGRGSVTCKIVDIGDVEITEGSFEIRFHSVASLRLDNVISAGFNVNRADCSDAIKKGIVYVNSVRMTKPDFILKQGDKIVFRGKGKIILYEVLGENKRGRMHVNIKHYT